MLQEKTDVYQRPGEPLRRWFEDADFQLIVWIEAHEIASFELSYDRGSQWCILKWSRSRGLRHYRTDEGEGKANKPQPAVALQDAGHPDKAQVQQIAVQFDKASKEIDRLLARFVFHTLLRYDPSPVKW